MHQRECQNCIQIESFDATDISATLSSGIDTGRAARLHAPFAGIQKEEAFSKSRFVRAGSARNLAGVFQKTALFSAGAANFKSLASTSSATSALLISIAFSSQAGKCFPIDTLAFWRDGVCRRSGEGHRFRRLHAALGLFDFRLLQQYRRIADIPAPGSLRAGIPQFKPQPQRPRLAGGGRSHSCRNLDCERLVGHVGLLPPHAPTAYNGRVVPA